MNDDYENYLRSPAWKQKADAAKRAAGQRCQVCNSPHDIDVHHRTYLNIFHESPADLVVLCHNCHARYHLELLEYTDEPLPPVVIFHGKSDSAWS